MKEYTLLNYNITRKPQTIIYTYKNRNMWQNHPINLIISLPILQESTIFSRYQHSIPYIIILKFRIINCTLK